MAKQKKAKGSPFGETSRVELLEQHLDAFGDISAVDAWRFVYEELLWFDRSTGLVHLYESDKVRPGRSSWYARSIAFTDRLAELFSVDRTGLKNKIDRLFLACLERLVEGKATIPGAAPIVAAVAEVGNELGIDPSVVEEAGQVAASEDFIPYAELLVEVTELLVSRAGVDDASAAKLAREIVDRAQFHLTFGSNRQNVLGEGFRRSLENPCRAAWPRSPRRKSSCAKRRTTSRDSREDSISRGASSHRTSRLCEVIERPCYAPLNGRFGMTARSNYRTNWIAMFNCYHRMFSPSMSLSPTNTTRAGSRIPRT